MITLRQRLDEQGPLPLTEATRLVAHLARSVEEPLAGGEPVFIVPGNIWIDETGEPALGQMTGQPEDARDLAAFAPELASTLGPSDRQAAIYSLGAVLYEALSGHTVGPARRPIQEACPGVPEHVEHLFQAALQPDRGARPNDLEAMAAALEHFADTAPQLAPPVQSYGQAAPPQAAPAPRATYTDAGDPFAVAVKPKEAPAPPRPDAHGELSQLKADLESDPRPRYVVHKDRMDHGPFNAVELLQQIASHVFTASHVLRDEVAGESRPIGEYPQFAPFAEHAGMHREIVAEKRAVVRAEQRDKDAGILKYMLGGGAILVLITAAVVVVLKSRGKDRESADILDDPSALDLQIDGGLKGQKRAAGGGGGGGGGGGFAGGMSYEAALNKGQELNMGGGGGNLSKAQLEGPLKSGAIITACGTPGDTKVNIGVAVQNGRAVGVTVTTTPHNGGVSSCIDRQVRGLSWPPIQNLESFRISF